MFSIASLLQLILFDNSAHAFSHKILESVLCYDSHAVSTFLLCPLFCFSDISWNGFYSSSIENTLFASKLTSASRLIFSIYSFLRSLRITITNCQRKVCMFIFIAQKNPRLKQARKIWSTSIWPPATRQNPHMNQSQFWPCRLSNRFQKYITLWALESLCPICQGKIMDSVQSKKNAHFLAANFHHR